MFFMDSSVFFPLHLNLYEPYSYSVFFVFFSYDRLTNPDLYLLSCARGVKRFLAAVLGLFFSCLWILQNLLHCTSWSAISSREEPCFSSVCNFQGGDPSLQNSFCNPFQSYQFRQFSQGSFKISLKQSVNYLSRMML